MTLGGKLLLAPIGQNPQRVLDVGTGTGRNSKTIDDPTLLTEGIGIWAIDFAE